jgi:hypothetical protein
MSAFGGKEDITTPGGQRRKKWSPSPPLGVARRRTSYAHASRSFSGKADITHGRSADEKWSPSLHWPWQNALRLLIGFFGFISEQATAVRAVVFSSAVLTPCLPERPAVQAATSKGLRLLARPKGFDVIRHFPRALPGSSKATNRRSFGAPRCAC